MELLRRRFGKRVGARRGEPSQIVKGGFVMLRSWLAALVLGATMPVAAPAVADEVAPSARVSSAVLVREGPSTDTAILARLRPGDSATLVGEVSGWYIVALANGTRGYVSKAWTIVRADDDREALAATPHKVHVIDVGTGLAVFVEGLCASLLRR